MKIVKSKNGNYYDVEREKGNWIYGEIHRRRGKWVFIDTSCCTFTAEQLETVATFMKELK